MKFSVALVLTFFCGAMAGSASSHSNPIAAVIEMLEAKSAKVKQDGSDEEATYNTYVQWCTESVAKLTKAIKDSKEIVETKSETAEALQKEIDALQKEIDGCDAKVGKLETRQGQEDAARSTQSDAYEKVQADIDGTISALKTALLSVNKTSFEASLGFLQTQKELLNEEQLEQLSAVLKADPAVYGESASYKKVYEYKSGGVIELLKSLLTKFEGDKLESTTAETNSLNSYDLAKHTRDLEKAELERIKSERTASLGSAQEALGDANTDKAAAEGDLNADTQTLSDTKKQCFIKGEQWKDRSTVRGGELKAIAAAIEVLEKVTGVRSVMNSKIALPPKVSFLSRPRQAIGVLARPPTKQVEQGHPKSKATQKAGQARPAQPTSFLQVDLSEVGSEQVSPRSSTNVLDSVASMLRVKSSVLHSKALQWLARQLTGAGKDYFGGAIDIINKMIWRLEDEQKKDTDHKYWCDQELSKTKLILDDKVDKEAQLTTEVEAKKADLNVLVSAIAAAEAKIAEYVTTMKKATEIRYLNKKENQKSIEDSQDAQKALSNAISTLEEFYKSSGGLAADFLQAPVDLPADPTLWTSSYTGTIDAGPSGIIATLTATSEQFSEMEADTKTQEAVDQQEFDELMKDSAVEKTRQQTDVTMKTEKKNRDTSEIQDLSLSLKGVATEVRAAKKYANDLAEACEQKTYFTETAEVTANTTSAFNLRQASRLEEIEALKSAKVIIYNATVSIAKVTAAPIAAPTLPPVPVVNGSNSSNSSLIVLNAARVQAANAHFPSQLSQQKRTSQSAHKMTVESAPTASSHKMIQMAEDATQIFQHLNALPDPA